MVFPTDGKQHFICVAYILDTGMLTVALQKKKAIR